MEQENRVIPIEVKLGNTGSIKFLYLFMRLKELSFAIRINSKMPNLTEINIKDH